MAILLGLHTVGRRCREKLNGQTLARVFKAIKLHGGETVDTKTSGLSLRLSVTFTVKVSRGYAQ